MLLQLKETKSYLFGEVLQPKQLKRLIIKSRKSGTVSLDKAHEQVRKKLTLQ